MAAYTIIRSGPAALLAALLCAPHAQAQALAEAKTGPVISEFGPVYAIDKPDFETPTDHIYRVVFDVSVAPESAADLNPRIETLARFLNMHAAAGVPTQNMKLALVLHGSAGKAALVDEAYHARFGSTNPNLELLNGLSRAGVRVILCGQTAVHRGLPREDLAETVEVSLSAMTALVTLQDEGYRLIAF